MDSLIPSFLVSFLFVEVILAISLMDKIQGYFKIISKTVYVLGNENISDHFKELVIPRYGLRIIQESLMLLVIFLGILTAYVSFFGGLEFYNLSLTSLDKVSLIYLSDVYIQVSFFVGAFCYYLLRSKKSKKVEEESYSTLEKSLHYLFLGTDGIRTLFFNLEDKIFGMKSKIEKPIFITGLARGGTTILLETLYSTGKFSSLTYRNMPFPLNPRLWGNLSNLLLSSGEKKERAHKDRIMVNLDSPEEFDEVFWLTFGKKDYVKMSSIVPYKVSEEVLDKYQRYISRVTKKGNRYISKNNNNTLRIDSLKRKFPDCSIIVPFRNPVEHAHSLYKQHKKYLKDHESDKFIKDYMGWLGHFEFGPGKRPFVFNDNSNSSYKDDNINYWLNYWLNVYQYLLDQEDRILFFDYDLFCEKPKEVWRSFCSEIEFSPTIEIPFLESISPAKKYDELEYDEVLLKRSMLLYEKIRLNFLNKYKINIGSEVLGENYEDAKVSATT